jgi:hypothetical protein
MADKNGIKRFEVLDTGGRLGLDLSLRIEGFEIISHLPKE